MSRTGDDDTQKIAESAQAAGQRAHGRGDHVTAEKLYRRALAHSEAARAEIYGNYGALLRELKKPKEAAAVYRRGLEKYPDELMLIRNYANLLLQEGHAAKALALYLKAEEVYHQITKKENDSNTTPTGTSTNRARPIALGITDT